MLYNIQLRDKYELYNQYIEGIEETKIRNIRNIFYSVFKSLHLDKQLVLL